ncbi:hypothetical protein [Chitinimonas lacunae]|uniref:Uncharacterized protein n=1 Tax=Chitinimonas lacunae TaxID=1963018 RepID=A0ABV8MLV7_9NEIS
MKQIKIKSSAFLYGVIFPTSTLELWPASTHCLPQLLPKNSRKIIADRNWNIVYVPWTPSGCIVLMLALQAWFTEVKCRGWKCTDRRKAACSARQVGGRSSRLAVPGAFHDFYKIQFRFLKQESNILHIIVLP